MTDPAVEAARRAWEAWFERAPVDLSAASAPVTLAAREALKPIRQEWEELSEAATNLSEYGSYLESAKADGMREVLTVLAPLIFTTEEINQ